MRVLYFAFLCLVHLYCISCEATEFPVIKNTSAKFEISVSDTPYFLSYPINRIDGQDLYWLLCFSGTDNALDKLSSESEINFVAPFACRLTTENERFSEKTFLAEQLGFSYWHSRGRFSFRELEEPCGSYPEYGKVRHFELRGFKLTMTVSNINISNQISSFTFEVKIVADSSATTEYAKPVILPPPKWGNGKCELPN